MGMTKASRSAGSESAAPEISRRRRGPREWVLAYDVRPPRQSASGCGGSVTLLLLRGGLHSVGTGVIDHDPSIFAQPFRHFCVAQKRVPRDIVLFDHGGGRIPMWKQTNFVRSGLSHIQLTRNGSCVALEQPSKHRSVLQ